MNEHDRNPIEFGLVPRLERARIRPTDEREKTVDDNPQKHGDSPQGIQVVVTMGRHLTPKSQPITRQGCLSKTTRPITPSLLPQRLPRLLPLRLRF